jgi:hypothetical protein
MKKLQLLILITISTTLSGCLRNWATQNEPITFIPEITKSLEKAQKLPIKLSSEQRELLLDSLGGPVRSNFINKKWSPDVWVSWGKSQGTITFARFSKENNKNYVYIDYFQNGHLCSSGGGRSGMPQWITK